MLLVTAGAVIDVFVGKCGCCVERGACACPKVRSLEVATDDRGVDEQVNPGPETSRVCSRAGSVQTVCGVEGAIEEKSVIDGESKI